MEIDQGRRGEEISIRTGRADSDGSFLLVPKKRKLDPFGQGFGGELRRLVTRGDRLDNLGSQERQPQQSADVIGRTPSRSAISATDCNSTRQQIVRPLPSPGRSLSISAEIGSVERARDYLG